MAKKEQKTKKVDKKKNVPKKQPKEKKPKTKKGQDSFADDGLVIIDEQIEADKEAELEARKAYLEEARSQEVED